MSRERFAAIDAYLVAALVEDDPALAAALEANARAGLPAIDVAPNQGKLLHLLARIAGARRILELGTLGGYSTIWLARALPPDGRLVTIEADPHHAEVARGNLARAGVDALVDLRVGPGLEVLPALAAEGQAPFDLIFVDADKASTDGYVRWALDLGRPGTLLIVDNVVRGGAVAEAGDQGPGVAGIRRFLELAAGEPRLDATAIQTVGAKGHDGFALAIIGGA